MQDERLAILDSVKQQIQPLESKLSKEIIELMDREEASIKRGMLDKLDGAC